jgi:hypothetical protein
VTLIAETGEDVGVEEELHRWPNCTRRSFSSSSTSDQPSSSP